VLERDDGDRDRFGRLLRHVWLPAADGLQLVGEGLVESGMVEARSYPPDTAPDDLLDRAGTAPARPAWASWGSC
jgi:endonuclease YncB( thermonuclease family)